MHKVYAILFLLFTVSVSVNAAVKTTKHAIKNGETLYIIAKKHHTTVAEVRKANGLKKGDNLRIGRVLKVPVNTYNVPQKKQLKPKLTKHAIKNGETLYIIAKKHHTTVAEVRKANGLKKGDNLKIGRVLKVPVNTYKVPQKKPIQPKLAKHKIKKGETLFSIAKKHRSTVLEVRNSNGLKKGDILKVGQILKVPSSANSISKPTIVKKTQTKKQKVVKTKKASSQKLVASISKLETLTLTKDKVEPSKDSSFSFSSFFSSKDTIKRSTKITSLAKKKLGRRYVWGASGKQNTFDCSGFTKYVYNKNGISIPRTSINQSKHGQYVSRKDLQKGDLVFFDTSKQRKGYVNHVGIYLGDGKFIHASSAKKKVVVSNLNKFYGKRYKGARRPS